MPKLRLYPEERQRKQADDPDRPVLSIECRCGHRYVLTVAAFQGAS
jgi:hypothetical protein